MVWCRGTTGIGPSVAYNRAQLRKVEDGPDWQSIRPHVPRRQRRRVFTPDADEPVAPPTDIIVQGLLAARGQGVDTTLTTSNESTSPDEWRGNTWTTPLNRDLEDRVPAAGSDTATGQDGITPEPVLDEPLQVSRYNLRSKRSSSTGDSANETRKKRRCIFP